jgi:hypothetical protein
LQICSDGDAALLPSFSAKAGNPEIQAVKKRQTHPAQWVGLRSLIRGLGVGGRKRERKEKGTGPPPADLHPLLIHIFVGKGE